MEDWMIGMLIAAAVMSAYYLERISNTLKDIHAILERRDNFDD